jgi:methionyl-tRNA formyltransferase
MHLDVAQSLRVLVKAMDAGPVYLQREVTLVGTESKQELADKLLAIGSELIIETLPQVLNGSLTPIEQKDDEATYDKLIEKSDGRIDWTKPATQLEREVRAYAGWPKSTATLHGIDITITKATATNEQGEPGSIKVIDKKLLVCCSDGALQIDRLIPAGKQETDAVSFLNGYGKHFY